MLHGVPFSAEKCSVVLAPSVGLMRINCVTYAPPIHHLRKYNRRRSRLICVGYRERRHHAIIPLVVQRAQRERCKRRLRTDVQHSHESGRQPRDELIGKRRRVPKGIQRRTVLRDADLCHSVALKRLDRDAGTRCRQEKNQYAVWVEKTLAT